jgi:hypothetical protein
MSAMGEERLRQEVHEALDRGYRPLGPAAADRILGRALGGARGDVVQLDRGRRRSAQPWLTAVAALLIAALTVATLLGVRGLHRTSPAGSAGTVAALRDAGRADVAAGRDDAAVAELLAGEGAFRDPAAMAPLAERLERQAPRLESADPGTVRSAAAEARSAAAAIHAALLAGLPAKAIVISRDAQQLWAYDHGTLLLSTPVTTGRPATPTDIGATRVTWKAQGYTMHSPWPPSSPNWYPTRTVRYMIMFSVTGEGLHDAAWQPCCYGRGSDRSAYASTGTVHVPLDAEATLFGWADVGTPVIVAPGDGSPVPRQVAALTLRS